jgi:hypothetical protein
MQKEQSPKSEAPSWDEGVLLLICPAGIQSRMPVIPTKTTVDLDQNVAGLREGLPGPGAAPLREQLPGAGKTSRFGEFAESQAFEMPA